MPLTPGPTARGVGVSARDFLVCGLLAGLFAGLLAFGVGYLVGEPSLNAAITAEAGTSGTEVPRSLQSTLGLATATTVAGGTLGGIVGVLSALALGRFGRLGVRGTALSVAGVGFVAGYVMPFVAYPASPPAVGESDTIGYRSALFFVFVAISLIAAVVAVLTGRRLADRWGAWYATLAAAAGYLVVTLVAIALMPSYDEVPAGFPARVLYDFRAASFVVQLTLWGAVGILTAELTHRLSVRRSGSTSVLVGGRV